MASIKISPDQVRSVAGQFQSKSQETGTMVQQLQTAVNSMQSEWQGMASQRFYNDYTQWNQQMQKYVQVLADIGNELTRIANTLEQTDQQLAGK